MGVENDTWRVLTLPPTPSAAPSYSYPQKRDHLAQFGNTVNAVSFGFVATAVLISMFLAMAIFEKFLRVTDTRHRTSHDLESQTQSNIPQFNFNHKFRYSSPKACTNNAPEVSVVMPGDKVPTFLANPAPCREESTASESNTQ